MQDDETMEAVGLSKETIPTTTSPQMKEVRFKEDIWSELSPKILFLVFIISAVIAVFGTFLWCVYTDSNICPTKGYFYAKAKYLYYYYWVPSDPDMSFY